MGRPPCCEKAGVKKGPWTPEEDLVLVSYVQEHGPGNWRAVPTNTGTFWEWISRCLVLSLLPGSMRGWLFALAGRFLTS